MKNLILIIALFLGIQNNAQGKFEVALNNIEDNLIDPNKTDFKIIQDLPYIETEESVELGFDTSKYLPNGFNPSVYYGDVLLSGIQYVENDETETLTIFNDSSFKILSEKDRNVLKSIKYIESDEFLDSENIFSQADRNFLKSIQFIENTEI